MTYIENSGAGDFQQALREGDLATAKEILAADPTRAVTPDSRGYPPLVMAAYYDHPKLMTLLHRAGAELDTSDPSGNTALMGAVFKGNEAAARWLIEAGANVNTRNSQGATALTYACAFNRPELAQLLQQFGANPDQKDQRGLSPKDHGRMQGLDWVNELNHQ